MDNKINSNKTNLNQNKEKSQVLDTAGGVMPDPNQVGKNVNQSDVESAFKTTQQKNTK